MNLYIILLHYPVYNKNKEIVATSIVTHDIHDISRASKTFGVKTFYVVQPLENERKMVERILQFWSTKGKDYNPNRLEAVSVLSLKESLKDVIDEISASEKTKPVLIGTSAQDQGKNQITFKETAELLSHQKPVAIVFGTGWGIAPEAKAQLEFFLPPINGLGEFNHLSVRSAASIVLDRIISAYKDLMLLHP
ncbi:MAG: RNA methyltransferase [Caldisericaceae bacterium]